MVWWPLGGVSIVVGPCGVWGVLVGCGGPCTSRRHKLPCLNSGTQSPTAASPRTCCRPRRARDPSSWGESFRGEGFRVMIIDISFQKCKLYWPQKISLTQCFGCPLYTCIKLLVICISTPSMSWLCFIVFVCASAFITYVCAFKLLTVHHIS